MTTQKEITTQWMCNANLNQLEEGLKSKPVKYIREMGKVLNSYKCIARSRSELISKIIQYIKEMRAMSMLGMDREDIQKREATYNESPLFDNLQEKIQIDQKEETTFGLEQMDQKDVDEYIHELLDDLEKKLITQEMYNNEFDTLKNQYPIKVQNWEK